MKRELLKKSIAFRVISVTVMALFFYIVTGSLKQMTILTAMVEVIKTIQYVIFEFYWKKYKKKFKKIRK